MSYTEIYSIGSNHCLELGEVKNAWRGAMYVWNQIAREYFGLDCFPHFDSDLQKRVWNAANYHDLSQSEIIVLASTMDRVTVKSSDLPRLISAFEQYGEKHFQSSFNEQAIILKSADLLPEHKIAWNQTSVNCFDYLPIHDESTDTYIYSDLEGSWDLFEQIDSVNEEN
ncbi:hypothetical protein [Shewanella sp. NIFS-20-20]|uniref:hypothetical protein n=1 Tax=Shewanella sp. NIFS-20-20 TaxID=2853806 RepID=UPI001C4386BB|nr:hypothetical protein [Shewanella sp. NIFS-20-20]MBV7315471.1 hypothetical protein [Shewanella sp. NIFS-20-20]